MNLIGNERIQKYFENIKPDALAQTTVFVGPPSVGKNTFATFLAARLLNISYEAATTHPAIFRLRAGEDPKTGTPRAAIPVAEVRSIRHLFHLAQGTPFIIIIERAEELQAESGNALLKILEEPGRQLYFFVLASHEDNVLQTIRSRAAMFRLSGVPDATLTEGLRASGASSLMIPDAVRAAAGRPGVAIKFMEDTSFRERYTNERARFFDVLGAESFIAAEKRLADLFEKKDRHIEARQNLGEMFEWWMQWLTEKKPGHMAIATIAKLHPLLFQNMHPRLIAERIVIALRS